MQIPIFESLIAYGWLTINQFTIFLRYHSLVLIIHIRLESYPLILWIRLFWVSGQRLHAGIEPG
nr:hypothetical protein [Providencia sp.]